MKMQDAPRHELTHAARVLRINDTAQRHARQARIAQDVVDPRSDAVHEPELRQRGHGAFWRIPADRDIGIGGVAAAVHDDIEFGRRAQDRRHEVRHVVVAAD